MEKILLIHFARMGDNVQALPLLRRLKQERPESRITLLCTRESSDVVLGSKDVDGFEMVTAADLDAARRSGRIDFFLQPPVGRESYDQVINLTYDPLGALLCGRIQASKKTGLIARGDGSLYVSGVWSKYMFATQRARKENLFNLVDMHQGLTGAPLRPVLSTLEVGPEEREAMARLLKSSGYRGKGVLIALQLGASRLHRAWPVERFAALTNDLLDHPQVEVFLIGSEKEKKLSRAFHKLVKKPVIDLMGKTGIADLPALLVCADLIVSNDTGPIHVAAAVGAKALGIYSSSAWFSETAPYGEGHVVLQAEPACAPCREAETCKDPVCRFSVEYEDVAAAIEWMLGWQRRPPQLRSKGVFAYRSAFLKSGALVYRPLEDNPISGNYAKALIQNTLWNKVLGVDQDPAFLAEMLLRMKQSPELHEEALIARENLLRYREFCLGVERPVERMGGLQSVDVWDGRRLMSVTEILNAAEERLQAEPWSMLKAYHQNSVAEVLYGNPRQAVRGVAEVYAVQRRMSEAFLNLLEIFCLPGIFGTERAAGDRLVLQP